MSQPPPHPAAPNPAARVRSGGGGSAAGQGGTVDRRRGREGSQSVPRAAAREGGRPFPARERGRRFRKCSQETWGSGSATVLALPPAGPPPARPAC